jgi:hypothetical protein
MYDGMQIYRAVVQSAASATGDITVTIPSALGTNNTLPITKIGRAPVSPGVWNVPNVGDQVLVAVEDNRFTNVFLLTSSVSDAFEGLVVNGNVQVSGAITSGTLTTGDITAGDITADTFTGNGAALTNIDHGSLVGLGDDDHPQYLRTDGTRAFTGTLAGNMTLSGDFSASSLTIDSIEIDPSGATVNQALVFDGVRFVPSNVVAGGGGGSAGGATNIRYVATVPSGSASVAIVHNLGSNDVMVEVYENSTGFTIYCGVRRINSNTITLTFDEAPALNQYKVVVFYPPASVGTGGGGGGGSSRFEYQQTTPSAQWSVAHSLNGYPLVNVTDSSGTQIFGDVTYPSTSQVVIDFTAPFTGVASLI